MSEVKYHEPKAYISAAEISARVREIAEKINAYYGMEELTVICTLKGSVIFFTDLIRHLRMPVVCEFLGTSSYGNQATSSGEIKMTLDVNEPLVGRNVLIVEDIVDTGLTLQYLVNHLKLRNPLSLRTAALLYKPAALKAKDLVIHEIGFEIPNKFVVGYGLDYAEKFRALPYIGVIE